jgi:hypothetical protein
MATVVLQYAGAALGTAIGGPVGGVVGRALGAIAGNIADQALFGGKARHAEGPRLNDLRVMASEEGAPIPRLWGRMRISGQVIWATNFEEVATTRTEKTSSKGGPKSTTTEYSYFANFAVALCEGEIARVGRAWADGKEIDLDRFTTRLYPGSEDQAPDSLIAAKEGAGNVPAYRGTAYIVFERLPLADFGNRLPQLSFEVFREAGGAASLLKAVNVIPGATEFGYDTRIVVRETAPGITESENAHASAERSDWTVSLDDLQASCANVEAVSLVVAWFGNDLRCGTCTLKPGVEAAAKATSPELWRVSGTDRAGAHLIGAVDGKPAFGGTPSDASVIRAIEDLKLRGLTVSFYPFAMMDIPAGNSLPDPYGGAAQGAYPWRGRITCHPAAGQPGSPDKTAAAATQVASFVGAALPSHFTVSGNEVVYSGPAEWSFRRMVLHYAKLCALAGGVDAFLIGSELRGLTTVRSAAGAFPFVDALVTLAAEVKAILPSAKISYAADWSEYAGYHPADSSNDHWFHLDPLWSSSAVDFIGIDNYLPLGDWRDGAAHLDRVAGVISGKDLDYLKAANASGEYYDWFYASGAEREAQVRTSITDGAYGKPWVFRAKDIRNWWSNQHFNRPGGVEAGAPTGWTPQSKPVWFTELGCPAIDKGANTPSAFFDAKSSNSALPYFSSGRRDDLMQQRYLRAMAEYWGAAGAHNPISSVYGASMVDASRSFFWAWDARPWPAFPALSGVWSDSANYPRGHWLNGRIGAAPVEAIIEAVCAEYGLPGVVSEGVEGLIDGFAIDRPMTGREALEALLETFAIDAVDSNGTLFFRTRNRGSLMSFTRGDCVEVKSEEPLFAMSDAQESELPSTLRLVFVNSSLDYRSAAVESRLLSASARQSALQLPCAISAGEAQARADIMLRDIHVGRRTLDLSLPPSFLALEPGDPVVFEGESFKVAEAADGAARRLKLRAHDMRVYEPPDAPDRGITAAAPSIFGKPDVIFMDLPLADTQSPHAPWIAAQATPWPGQLALLKQTGPASFALNRSIDAGATSGALTAPLLAGPLYVYDETNTVTVKLNAGALVSVSEAELLAGANAAAIGEEASGFEIVQFQTAELIASSTYRLGRLLRAQSGSEPEMLASRAAGSRFVLLNAAVVQPVLPLDEAALVRVWRAGPAQFDHGASSYREVSFQGKLLGLRPLAPCQLHMNRDGGDVVFGWIRRTRVGGDSWELAEVPLAEESETYTIDILDGAAVKRSVTVASPAYRYLAADIAADFGSMPPALSVRVTQNSTVYGRGAVTMRTFNA